MVLAGALLVLLFGWLSLYLGAFPVRQPEQAAEKLSRYHPRFHEMPMVDTMVRIWGLSFVFIGITLLLGLLRLLLS